MKKFLIVATSYWQRVQWQSAERPGDRPGRKHGGGAQELVYGLH